MKLTAAVGGFTKRRVVPRDTIKLSDDCKGNENCPLQTLHERSKHGERGEKDCSCAMTRDRVAWDNAVDLRERLACEHEGDRRLGLGGELESAPPPDRRRDKS